jgi:hypothetical protein
MRTETRATTGGSFRRARSHFRVSDRVLGGPRAIRRFRILTEGSANNQKRSYRTLAVWCLQDVSVRRYGNGSTEPSRSSAMTDGRPCRFCGATETITVSAWPEWATRLIVEDSSPKNAASTVQRVKEEIFHALPSAPKKFIATRKLRVACRKCHRGWMGRLDAQVRPLLLPLINGTQLELTPMAQKALAAWIAKTVMIAEFASHNTVITPRSERQSLRKAMAAPMSWNIWIAYNHSRDWVARYVRHSARLGPVEGAAKSTQKDTQSVTLGMRSALVHVMMSTVAGMNFELPASVDSFHCLWPADKTISWPPRGTLSHDDMETFSEAFNRDFGSPEVEHIGAAA